ncbi:EAL domain-containing protein [Thioalkalivibrio sp. ALE23]|uniref:EAL domain-containing response regulator n=1 Tax=Thioalkalivibrio sp. ALE23 TaxID=1265495 RepID=UPI00036889E7|nr:EAL domain-containing protein [Thioalkalivibrio sp. ALE23]
MLIPEHHQTAARILIVDDNPMNVELLSTILEDAGFTNVHGETSPQRALETWREEAFDLLLLDIRMPGMDGHQVMENLNAELGEGDWLPVIVLTAQIDPDTRQRALAGGALDFITKPFDASEVVQRISNLLRVRALHNATHNEVQDLSQSLETQSLTLQRKDRDLEYLAHHDLATDLPNRAALLETLERWLADAAETVIDLVMLRVSGHETLERMEGHAAADPMLRETGQRLQGRLDAAVGHHGGICGLWGGATFLLLARSEHGLTDDALRDMLDTALQRLQIGQYEVRPEIVAGHARTTEAGHDTGELIRRVMLTLSKADRRRMQWLTYDPELEAAARRRHRLEHDLGLAHDDQGLSLLYQPKIHLPDGMVTGFEALMRWDHPEFGRVSPGEFIPVAETTGAVVNLGEWALREALAATSRRRASTGDCYPVAVNISARQFEARTARGNTLTEAVRLALEQTGTPPQCLEVEITETAIMHNLDQALEELHALRELGVSIAIDDFGTGYSSLAYLRRLPVSTVKVDRALVDGIAGDPDMRRLFEAILAVSRGFGLETVAEGIETRDDADLLRELGCPVGQGFLYHRPLPEADARALIAPAQDATGAGQRGT